MRGKPKYTPDPPLADIGDLSNLPLDEAFRRFVDWTKKQVEWNQRQEYRTEDYWPKDQSEIIAFLLENMAFITGAWPIVDYSTVFFDGQAGNVFQDEIFLYSNVGSDYYRSNTDYTDFDTPASSTVGFGDFEDIISNDQGQAIAWRSGVGTYYRTSDGINFTSFTITDIAVARGIAWYGDRWIAVGNEGATGTGITVASSTDGITWNQLFKDVTRDIEPVGERCVATDGSRIIVAGQDNNASKKAIFISDNGGTTWSSDETIDQTETVVAAFYQGSNWFYSAHDGQLWTSPTANVGSWTKTADLGTGTDRPINLVYGNGVWLMKIVGETSIYRSTNLTSWSSVRAADPNTGGQALAYLEGSGFIYCYSTVAQWSADGSSGTWQNTNLGATLGFAARAVLRLAVQV